MKPQCNAPRITNNGSPLLLILAVRAQGKAEKFILVIMVQYLVMTFIKRKAAENQKDLFR
jgi:hypothetical protein